MLQYCTSHVPGVIALSPEKHFPALRFNPKKAELSFQETAAGCQSHPMRLLPKSLWQTTLPINLLLSGICLASLYLREFADRGRGTTKIPIPEVERRLVCAGQQGAQCVSRMSGAHERFADQERIEADVVQAGDVS